MHTVGNGKEVIPRDEGFGAVRDRVFQLLNPHNYQSQDFGQDIYEAV